MPGPIALRHLGDGWVVQCRLCHFVCEPLADDEGAEDVAYHHVVEARPAVEEP